MSNGPSQRANLAVGYRAARLAQKRAGGPTMNETQEQLRAEYADFDFLIGRWKIRHRRLREILKGSTSWDEFEGYAVDRKILGGLGSISEVTLQLASGPLQGMTTRLFDPKTGQWRIYWTAGPDGAFTTPMI